MKICNKGNYDIKEKKGALGFLIMAIFYGIATIYLIIRLVYNLFKSRNFRSNSYSIVVYTFIILQLIARIFYFIGGITPFCYDNKVYALFADYPSILQSISMIALSLNYINTMDLIQGTESSMYKIYRKASWIFIILYVPVFIITHTIMLIFIHNKFAENGYRLATVIGQGLIFISFMFLSCTLANQLRRIYSDFSSKAIRVLLYIFSCLLITRLPIGVLYIIEIITKLKKNNWLYIYLIVSSITFEVLPAIILLILSSIQEKQRNRVTAKKINLSEILSNREKNLVSDEEDYEDNYE